jgi:hypothetical protein
MEAPLSQGGPVVPAAYVGPAIIREVVTVSSSGKTFEGTFRPGYRPTSGGLADLRRCKRSSDSRPG